MFLALIMIFTTSQLCFAAPHSASDATARAIEAIRQQELQARGMDGQAGSANLASAKGGDGKVTVHGRSDQEDASSVLLSEKYSAIPIRPGEVRKSPRDMSDRSVSIAVKIPSSGEGNSKTSHKKSSKSAGVESAAAAAAGKDGEVNHDKLFEEEGEDRSNAETYFATFDATALSTAWVKLGSQSKELEERASRVEKQRRLKQGVSVSDPSQVTVTVSRDSVPTGPAVLNEALSGSSSSSWSLGGASFEIANTASKRTWPLAPPEMTKPQIASTTMEARRIIDASVMFKRLDPSNFMSHIQRQLPLVIYMMCGCELDMQFAKALKGVEAAIHKRRWNTRFTFTYLPPEADRVFELTTVYKLDSQSVAVGSCLEPNCPFNEKTVLVRFEPPFPEGQPPRDLTVSLTNECCGDKFELSVTALTHSGFALKVKRIDGEMGKGWGQALKVRWASKDRFATPGGVPALVLDNVPMGVHLEKYVMRSPIPLWATAPEDVDLASRAVIAFLEDFQVGRLPLVVRSQPVSSPAQVLRDAAKKGSAVDVVADNFREIVLDQKRDVLLLIHSPFCPGSIAIMPLIDQLAQSLGQVPDAKVMVAKFDKTQNDFPMTGVKVTHFPTIYYFPAGDFDTPSYRIYDYADFNGSKQPHNPLRPHSHFTKEMLLKFIYEHGRNAAAWPADLAREVMAYKPELYTHDHDHEGEH